jgi:hypothetical protein
VDPKSGSNETGLPGPAVFFSRRLASGASRSPFSPSENPEEVPTPPVAAFREEEHV